MTDDLKASQPRFFQFGDREQCVPERKSHSDEMLCASFATGDLEVLLEVLLQHLRGNGLLVSRKSVSQNPFDCPDLENSLNLSHICHDMIHVIQSIKPSNRCVIQRFVCLPDLFTEFGCLPKCRFQAVFDIHPCHTC